MEIRENKSSKIRISADEMEAFLLLPEPVQGDRYTKVEIMDMIREGRVIYGVDESTVDRIIGNRLYGMEVRIARGKKPINGQDGFYRYNFNMDLNNKPTIREDGSVDYWSVHSIEMVEQGQVIATYNDPVEGENGMTVTGKAVLAKRGRPQPPLTGKGFSRSEDNKTYTADLTGKIEMKNNRIQILSVYEVQGDVDVHTGNIDFRGDVIIHGNVTIGAVVKATGSITVDGICEACTLEAGKDILLRGGVLGGHKAVIHSKGSISAKFFEYSTVEAEGDISVNSALSSQIISYSHIFLEGKQASVVGGHTYATAGIEADNLGNIGEVRTEVHVGAKVEILKTIIDLQNSLTEANATLDKIVEGLDMLEEMARAQGTNMATDERRITLLRTKMAKQAEIAADNKELERLNNLVERGQGAIVRVINTVYPGTVVTIDQTTLTVKDEQKSIDFKKRKGNIVMEALGAVID